MATGAVAPARTDDLRVKGYHGGTSGYSITSEVREYSLVEGRAVQSETSQDLTVVPSSAW